ncbi:MAG: hypothetical protein U9Q04_02775 [Campylobacterota bacterium]|nr:hypothetical protein [Campylobacterota bacterium]
MFKTITKSSLFLMLSLTALNATKSYVTQSHNLKGDMLIAPLYVANSEICSNIKVMNTNEFSSILAKVAIRESIASHEVDFPIMLSPGDVWEGNICDVAGEIVLTSNDDSNHPSALKMMKNGINLAGHSEITSYRENDYNKGYVELNGKPFKLEEVQKENLDYSRGYVEVYPIAQYDEKSKKKVDKKVLLERWERLIENDTSDPKLRKDGVDEESLSGLISYNTEDHETSALPMYAFKNTHNYQRSGDDIYFTSDSNPDKLIGKDNKIKILKLLQKKQTSFTYDKAGADQFIYITYPFSYKEKQSRKYKLIIRDMCENKFEMVFSPIFIMHREVACISVEELIKLTKDNIKFEKGMIQIKDLTNNDEVQLGKDNAPSVIPVITRISKIGDKLILINANNLPTTK